MQGPTGAGKTYVACALGNKACQQYRKVLYLPAGELFDRITIAERTGDKKRCLDHLVNVELLIIDDWFLTPPTRPQVQQLHTLIDRRHKTASTIYCSQLPPGQWHDRMEEKILADAIVDRITTNAHATVLDCDDSRANTSPNCSKASAGGRPPPAPSTATAELVPSRWPTGHRNNGSPPNGTTALTERHMQTAAVRSARTGLPPRGR